MKEQEYCKLEKVSKVLINNIKKINIRINKNEYYNYFSMVYLLNNYCTNESELIKNEYDSKNLGKKISIELENTIKSIDFNVTLKNKFCCSYGDILNIFSEQNKQVSKIYRKNLQYIDNHDKLGLDDNLYFDNVCNYEITKQKIGKMGIEKVRNNFIIVELNPNDEYATSKLLPSEFKIFMLLRNLSLYCNTVYENQRLISVYNIEKLCDNLEKLYSINVYLPLTKFAITLLEKNIIYLKKYSKIKLIKIIHVMKHLYRNYNETFIKKLIYKIILC